MAQTMSSEEMLRKAVNDAVKFDTEIKVGEDAVKVGDKTANTDYSTSGGLQRDDIVHFPADEASLVRNSLAKGKNMSVMCIVERKGKPMALRIYGAWFTLCAHPVIDKDKKLVSEDWVKHNGAPAEYARSIQGSKADMFRAMLGAVVKVENVRKADILGIKRGTVVAEGARLTLDQQESQSRKFYDYSWVDEPTNERPTPTDSGADTDSGAVAE